MSQTRYTSRAEMAYLFRAQGIPNRLGEDGFDQDDILNWYIDDASSSIGIYLEQRYLPADLATSPWVRIRATWWACFLLSQMGGDPSLFSRRVEEIKEEVKLVANGTLPLAGLATRADFVPSMSNIEHDPRYFDATRRVDQTTSTPSTGGTRPRDLSDQPMFFNPF